MLEISPVYRRPFRDELEGIVDALVEKGLDRCVCENIVCEHFTRLTQRGTPPEHPAAEWRERLMLAAEWWSGPRLGYDHEIVNQFRAPGPGREAELRRVSALFEELLAAGGGRFAIYSGGSGAGKSTIWERLTAGRPGKFEKFLLYTTSGRRVQQDFPADSAFGRALEAALENPGVNSHNFRAHLHGRGIELTPVEEALFMQVLSLERLDGGGWARTPEGAIRKITISERIGRQPDGRLCVYSEFDGVHYFFVPHPELEELGRRGEARVFDMRGLLQGYSVKALDRALRGEGALTVLECTPEMALAIKTEAPREISTVFVAPDYEAALKAKEGAAVWRVLEG